MVARHTAKQREADEQTGRPEIAGETPDERSPGQERLVPGFKSKQMVLPQGRFLSVGSAEPSDQTAIITNSIYRKT
jgi:hypothetical protein